MPSFLVGESLRLYFIRNSQANGMGFGPKSEEAVKMTASRSSPIRTDKRRLDKFKQFRVHTGDITHPNRTGAGVGPNDGAQVGNHDFTG